jgi:Ni/Co efflux regulator RcnB
MRKIIILGLMAAAALPSIASAQSAGEVRHSQRELREEKRDLRQAQRHGSARDVREQRRDVREARQEVREDWRDYRRAHRDVYRGGRWNAPFRYRAWNTGSRIDARYYNSRYYINDTYRYRLPRPGWNQRWVRHYNDVLLIDVRSGRVLTVHRGFFW